MANTFSQFAEWRLIEVTSHRSRSSLCGKQMVWKVASGWNFFLFISYCSHQPTNALPFIVCCFTTMWQPLLPLDSAFFRKLSTKVARVPEWRVHTDRPTHTNTLGSSNRCWNRSGMRFLQCGVCSRRTRRSKMVCSDYTRRRRTLSQASSRSVNDWLVWVVGLIVLFDTRNVAAASKTKN